MRKIAITFVFCMVLFKGTILFADTTWVSGTIVNQTWDISGSPYCVDNDILVQGTGLEIQPGVEIVFFGDYVFEVGGRLLAIGTEQDSIVFTRSDTLTNWHGIFFNYNTNEELELAYCIIKYSINHGIFVDNSSPIIRHCTITNNSFSGDNTNGGGGIFALGELNLENCLVSNNISQGGRWSRGGGIYVSGQLAMHSCNVVNNTAYSSCGSQSNCISLGGGIFVDGSFILSNSAVRGNVTDAAATFGNWGESYSYGAGIYSTSISTTSILASVIDSNSAIATCWSTGEKTSEGGGINLGNDAAISNTIIAHNILSVAGAAGVRVEAGNVDLVNCTIAFNNYSGLENVGGTVSIQNSIVYYNPNEPVGVQIEGDVSVIYSDIQFAQIDSLYPGEGNMNENPNFYSPDSLVIVSGSPCTDVGNPDAIYNDECFPPSLGEERNDMGAHGGPGGCGWVDGSVDITEERNESIPSTYILRSCYPNPFNARATIEYKLPNESQVRIDIYNLLGKKVETLIDSEKQAGWHKIIWDADKYTSGVYFYTLQTGEFAETKKMVLLK